MEGPCCTKIRTFGEWIDLVDQNFAMQETPGMYECLILHVSRRRFDLLWSPGRRDRSQAPKLQEKRGRCDRRSSDIEGWC